MIFFKNTIFPLVLTLSFFTLSCSDDTITSDLNRDSEIPATEFETKNAYVNFTGELTQVLSAPGASEDDLFSSSVAVDKNVAVVGAPNVKNDEDMQTGAAYVFSRQGDQWQYNTILFPDNVDNFGSFGLVVAVSKGVIAVSDPSVNLVYVFENKGQSWSLATVIEPEDEDPRDNFGSSLAVDGKYLAVGDPDFREVGTVYLYERKSKSWDLVDVVSASNGSIADSFGSSISLSGSTLLASARLLNAGYIFERRGKTWQETDILLSNEPAHTAFGASVSLSGKTAVIGDPLNGEVATSAGAAFIFEKKKTSWTQTRKLTDPDGEEEDRFGESVAIDRGLIAIGAPAPSTLTSNSPKSFYVKKQGNSWGDLIEIISADVRQGDLFGQSVAVSGRFVFVGAPGDDKEGTDAGKAYVFE